ncbi:MAG: hypothetical protein K0T99_02915 [Alphaproteobacteria bacterium]|nr:hypothetical protein [Alphaproteobacteria bacterium]
MDSLCINSQEVMELLDISGSNIPHKYIEEKCDSTLLYDAQDWLVKETQEKFFVRKGERHVSDTPEWVKDNKEKIFISATSVFDAILSEKKPINKEFDCVAILGSSRKESEKRIDYTLDLIKSGLQFNELYLLTGERKIWNGELTEDEKKEIKESKIGLDQNIYETDMMRYLFNAKSDLDAKIIDTKPCNNKEGSNKDCSRNRPNTVDTIEAFLDQKYCTSVAFISRAPNIIAQYESVAGVMHDRSPDIYIEVIGGSANLNEIPQDKQDRAIYHILMPLAGALFGSYERVSEKISEYNGQCPVDAKILSGYKYNLSYRNKS